MCEDFVALWKSQVPGYLQVMTKCCQRISGALERTPPQAFPQKI